ncbi:MAG: U32 family peptidase [Candidatus Omnitrophica bacterium]|nr:U32 family peptidase [Candidatus Omnitrophota bacterium]
MLKIIAPFKEKEEVMRLIDAGADELYCGYMSPEWARQYTAFEFERKGGGSNFTDLKELTEAVTLAHSRNTPVHLTLNGLYVKEQYPLLLKIISQLEGIDIDSYIVADIGLLLTLREMGCTRQIHISTGGTVFNSEAVRFYKRLGASRIVLDRQTTLESMRTLSDDNPDIAFEVFVLNTLCVYTDGFCTFLHTAGRDSTEDISHEEWGAQQRLHVATAYDPQAESDACWLDYSVETFDHEGKKVTKPDIRPTFHKHLIDGVQCGACALYDINKTKISLLKIVGRQLDAQKRFTSTRFIRAVLDIIENNNGISKIEFIHQVQHLYQTTFNYADQCRGNNCYHPSVILEGGYRK